MRRCPAEYRMRIVDSTNTGNSASAQTSRAGQTQATQPAGGGAAQRGKGAESSDRVELSGFSGRVAEALRTDSQDRAGRVAKIAQAVQSGAYKVDARAVSHALVNEAISTGGTAR